VFDEHPKLFDLVMSYHSERTPIGAVMFGFGNAKLHAAKVGVFLRSFSSLSQSCLLSRAPALLHLLPL
jgi:hypothetical protein